MFSRRLAFDYEFCFWIFVPIYDQNSQNDLKFLYCDKKVFMLFYKTCQENP